jgi:hypothetical protein
VELADRIFDCHFGPGAPHPPPYDLNWGKVEWSQTETSVLFRILKKIEENYFNRTDSVSDVEEK